MRYVLGRVLQTAFVLTVVAFVVLPNLPSEQVPLGATLSKWAMKVSFKQGWQMYSPNPQRAQIYMNLTALYDDGSKRHLEESIEENAGWHTHWMWNKTRVDIWRQYANFGAKRRNDNRTWYLKGVCVREARRGPIPDKIKMFHVRRRFVAPEKVAAGAPALGQPKRSFITVAYCKQEVVREMIEADRARRGEPPA